MIKTQPFESESIGKYTVVPWCPMHPMGYYCDSFEDTLFWNDSRIEPAYTLRIQIWPRKGIEPIESYDLGMGLEPQKSYSIGRCLDS